MNRWLRDELIADHMEVVRFIAIQIRRRITYNIELDDLVSYGYVGLIEAAGRFEPNRGLKFNTYAQYRVKGAIYDGLRAMGWLGRGEYQLFHRQELVDSAGGAKNILVSLSVLIDAVSSAHFHGKRKEALANTGPICLTELAVYELGEEPLVSADILLEDMQIHQQVRSAVEQLPTREKKIVNLYYYQDWSLEEVGRELGFSKSWASRLHARALQHLARQLKRPPGIKVMNEKSNG